LSIATLTTQRTELVAAAQPPTHRNPMSQRISQVLTVLFLVLLALLVLNAPEVVAACIPDPPMDNDAVVCDGTDSTE
jgi:hypothetical protein